MIIFAIFYPLTISHPYKYEQPTVACIEFLRSLEMKNRLVAAGYALKISLYQAAIFIAVNITISIRLSISEALSTVNR